MATDPTIFVIPDDRVVVKSTTCANCKHFDAASQEVLREWRMRRDDKIDAIKLSPGGMQLDIFASTEATRIIAHLLGKGMSIEAANVELEKMVLIKIHELVGPGGDMWAFDRRVKEVTKYDSDFESGKIGACSGGGVDKDGDPLHFVYSAYHCHKWNGREGWSVAHGTNQLDPLPAELTAIADAKAKKA